MPSAVDDGVVQAGLGAGVLEPVDIALLVAELQRVDRDLGVLERLVCAVVEEESSAAPWPAIFMWWPEAGMTHWLLFEVLVEDHLAGLRDP